MGSLLLCVLGAWTAPGIAQVPPVRFEVRVEPAVPGVVIEVLGTEVVRATGADGVAVLAVPSGMLDLLLRSPGGREMTHGVLVPPSGGSHRVVFEALAEEVELARGPAAEPQPGAGLDAEGPTEAEASPTAQEVRDGSAEGALDRDTGTEPPNREESRSGSADAPNDRTVERDDEEGQGVPLGVLGLLSLGLLGALGMVRRRTRRAAGPDDPTRIWLPQRATPDADDRQLHGFHLHEEIGRGGMATVWRASDSAGQPVALKVMNPELARDPELRRKFTREGEVLERIHECWPESPVVRPVDWGPRRAEAEHLAEEERNPGGEPVIPWVAMEYLDAPTLMEFLKSCPGGAGEAFRVGGTLRLVRQVAEALHAAHDLGIYHRDLSPDNLLLLSEDRDRPVVRVIDFGVARHEFTQIHTLDGSVFGKPAYMAPEQGVGLPVDGRADLYSLGILLHLLLEGKVPFEDRNPIAVLRMHAEEPLPPMERGGTPRIRQLVFDLLEKRTEDRVPDARTLIQRLDELLETVAEVDA